MQKNIINEIYFVALYSAPLKKRAFPGTDAPASDRHPSFMSESNHSGDYFPLPTSSIEPTMALTIFLRQRSARILNTR